MIDKNLIFIQPYSKKTQLLLERVSQDDDFMIFEVDALNEYGQIIGVLEQSITVSSDLQKTKIYLQESSDFVRVKDSKNILIQDSEIPSFLLSKLKSSGLNEVILEEISLDMLMDKIHQYFEVLDVTNTDQSLLIGETQAIAENGRQSSGADEKSQTSTGGMFDFNNQSPNKSLVSIGKNESSFELKLNRTNISFIHNPFDRLQRRNIKVFTPRLNELDLKKLNFNLPESDFTKNPYRASLKVSPGGFSRKKIPNIDQLNATGAHHKKVDFPSGTPKRQNGMMLPSSEKNNKSSDLTREDFSKQAQETPRQKEVGVGVGGDFERKSITNTDRKKMALQPGQNSTKADLDTEIKKQAGRIKSLENSQPDQNNNLADLHSEDASDLFFADNTSEKQNDSIDASLELDTLNRKTQELRMLEQLDREETEIILTYSRNRKKGWETELDYQDIYKEYQSGRAQLNTTLAQKIKNRNAEKLIEDEEFALYDYESYGLEYFVLYQEILEKGLTDYRHLFHFCYFALNKKFKTELVCYSKRGDEINLLYNSHQEDKEFKNLETHYLEKCKATKVPTWADETFQAEKNEFIFPYSENGEILGFAVCLGVQGGSEPLVAERFEFYLSMLKGVYCEDNIL